MPYDYRCPQIACVGGGAKGVALACKASALADAGCPVRPHVTIIEPMEIGHLWREAGGYSDGDPLVCTHPLRDLGFPYWPVRTVEGEIVVPDKAERSDPRAIARIDQIYRRLNVPGVMKSNSELWPDVEKIMFTRFSLNAYLIGIFESGDHLHYGHTNLFKRWVDGGGRHISHLDFGLYLERSFRLAQGLNGEKLIDHWKATVTPGGVTRLASGKWKIAAEDDKGVLCNREFDAVVITGVGKPLLPISGADEISAKKRYFNAMDFWNVSTMSGLIEIAKTAKANHKDNSVSGPGKILIIGGGGAAVAIASRLRRDRIQMQIVIAGTRAALAPRHPSRFVEMYYGDDELWDGLPDEEKSKLVGELAGGRPWAEAMTELESLSGVDYVYGKVGEVKMIDDCTFEAVVFKDDGASFFWPKEMNRFNVLIDARGFGYEEYVSSFLSDELGRRVRASSERTSTCKVSRAFELEDEHGRIASLHLPNLRQSARVNPAAANLMALGWFSTTVLRPYIHHSGPGV